MPLDAAQCFSAFRSSVYRWAYALLGRNDQAEDVTQDVFVRLLKDRAEFAHAAPARAWLRTTTTRLVFDRYRSDTARRGRENAQHKADLTDTQPLERSEELEQLRIAMRELSEQQRLVLLCKCYDQMTFAQIAAELSLAEPTVKTHYLRALEALRKRLRASPTPQNACASTALESTP